MNKIVLNPSEELTSLKNKAKLLTREKVSIEKERIEILDDIKVNRGKVNDEMRRSASKLQVDNPDCFIEINRKENNHTTYYYCGYIVFDKLVAIYINGIGTKKDPQSFVSLQDAKRYLDLMMKEDGAA